MQGFTPGAPALNSSGSSQPIRDNFSSLLSNQSGPSLPGYAVEGMLWYNTDDQRIRLVKARGTKAYLYIQMGA